MLQAAIEDYLHNGASGDESFNTIFAFGCPGVGAMEGEGEDIQAMRKVFCDPENEHGQVHGWSKTRRQYINEVWSSYFTFPFRSNSVIGSSTIVVRYMP